MKTTIVLITTSYICFRFLGHMLIYYKDSCIQIKDGADFRCSDAILDIDDDDIDVVRSIIKHENNIWHAEAMLIIKMIEIENKGEAI